MGGVGGGGGGGGGRAVRTALRGCEWAEVQPCKSANCTGKDEGGEGGGGVTVESTLHSEDPAGWGAGEGGVTGRQA